MSVAEKLKEAEGKIAERRKNLHQLFDEAGPEVDMAKVRCVGGDSKAKVDQITQWNKEIDELAVEIEGLKQQEKGIRNAAARGEKGGAERGAGQEGDRDRRHDGHVKSFGEAFMESDAYKVKGAVAELHVEIKTLFQTTAGWTPESTRGPRLILDEQRPIQMVDVIPQRTTDQTAIKYMEETTFTNAAAETAEGAAKPEAALALTERTSDVRKIAVWIPVTDEQLEDVPGIRQYLDNRLTFMIRQRLDGQIVSGNGTAPNLRGILNVVGIQTQAKGADPVPDAIYKAMTKVEVTGQAIPDAVVFHPNDWQDVRLLRTADGIYIWGNPSEAGPERIWGLRAIKVQAATENTAIVGDFGNFTELAVKKGLEVRVSDSHSTYFVENKQAVRCEMRAAFTVFRPTAMCSVTGI